MTGPTLPLRRFLCAAFALSLVLGCSSGDGSGLLDAGVAAPLFDDLYQEAKHMTGVAAVVAGAGAGDDVPLAARRALERLGGLARQVVETVELPDAYGAVTALERAARDLTLAAGGHDAGRGHVAIRSVIVAGLTPENAALEARKELEDEARTGRAKETLRSYLRAAAHWLAYAGLLVDPASQAAFAPRLSPTDLPAQLPVNPTDPTGGVDALIEGFESVGEWRDHVFSDRDLVVPNPNVDAVAWDAFLAWAQYVNPDLAVAADNLYEVFDDIFLSVVPGAP
ncbi:MAG: hypothetical protein ACRD0C_20040 [Acidimicrobiia bacterium]